MAVVFDNSSGSRIVTTSPITVATALNVGSGTNRALVVVVSAHNATDITSVTWDSGGTNQAMTLITNTTISGSSGFILSVWGLIAPTSGNHTISVVFGGGGTSDNCVALVSFTGVNQTGGDTTFPHGNTNTVTDAAPTVTITSAVGNAIVAGTANVQTGGVNSVSDTQILINNVGAINFGSNWAAGAASHAMTAVLSASSLWISAGTDVLASGAGADTLMPMICM